MVRRPSSTAASSPWTPVRPCWPRTCGSCTAPRQIVVHGVLTSSYPIDIDPTWTTSSTPTATLTNSGGASGDTFGSSVALSSDGSTAVIGTPGVNSHTGAAYVFHVSGESSWATSSAPTATLTNSGAASDDSFGSSVALSADGTTAVIGASGVNSNVGAAYVFHVSGEGSWATSSTPTAILTNSGGASGSDFGVSVALSADGTTALIGANGVNSAAGAAYVFHVSGEGSWATTSAPTATLTNSGGASGAQFGISVALSAVGTTALIGATGVNTFAGAAYVFHVSGEGSWAASSTPTATLTNSGGASFSQFGNSVALSADGTTTVIGGEGVSSSTGAAYVFHVAGEGSWATSSAPTATLTNSGGASGSEFGISVALTADGTTTVIGAEGVSSSTGAAYVFHVAGEGAWATSSAPTATLTNSAGASDDAFGSSVALSADGTTAVIGAFSVNSGTGAAYAFHVSGASWTTTSTPTATSTNSSDQFGTSVAISNDGTTAIIGAPNVNSGTGAVYVFHDSGEGSWASSSTPTATLTYSGGSIGHFGSSIALSADGTTAVIGAPYQGSAGDAAYVYNVSSEGSWATTSTPTAILTNSALTQPAEFGSSVALSADGTTALIGTPDVSGDGGASGGAAYVYHVSSEGSWATTSTPTATLTNLGDAFDVAFGGSVALSADGTTAVIGAVGVNTFAGAAYVFQVSGEGSWATSSTPTATLTNSSGASYDQFGQSVSLSADGTTALIGTLGVNTDTNAPGVAYVYHVSTETSWATTSTPTATLTNSGEASLAEFGSRVAISADGTTAFIGAYGVSTGTGAAYVFHVSSEGSWATTSTPTATLTNSSGASGDLFGTSVALSADGTTAVIGAPGVTGAAYVYHVSSETSWATTSTPTATLSKLGGASGDVFGTSVAISADGTTAVIGAPGVNSSTGAAYVFHVSGDGSWVTSSTPTATLTNSAGASFDVLGTSVAISADGTTAVIGAPGVSSNTGAAYVFHVSGEGSWATSSTPTATLTNSGGASGDLFGTSVALSADGTTAVIGAYGVSSFTGAAYVFHVSGEGSWATTSAPTATLTNSGGTSDYEFAWSVALSADGTTAVIGSYGVSSFSGAAYVFHVSGEGSWATISTPTATLTNSAGASDDGFGYSVALSADGTTALIGAPGVSSNTGAAYVFHASGEGSWATSSTPAATLTNSSGASGDDFSSSVAISADGTIAVIGAYGVNSSTGAAYVFQVSGEGSWTTSSTPTATLTNSVSTAGYDFGFSAALSADGATSLIGTNTANAASVFHVSGSALATPSTPSISNLPSSGTYGGGFTATVATTGDGTKSVTSNSTGVCTASGLAVSYVGRRHLLAHRPRGGGHGLLGG